LTLSRPSNRLLIFLQHILAEYGTNQRLAMNYQTPTTFFRVESKTSCARRRGRRGILAQKRSTLRFSPDCPEILEMVLDHLYWRSKIPSPFISVYSDLDRAEQEADRRVKDRHEDIVIWVIDTNLAKYKTQYRNLRRFAKKGGVEIPKFAQHNSEHEWLFLNKIPDAMIVGSWPPTKRSLNRSARTRSRIQ
jgi:hypothetical protein